MEYKDKNFAWKDLPALENGDVIRGGNWARPIVEDIPQNLTLISDADSPLSMLNCNLTGQCQYTGTFNNGKRDFCYWLHPERNLENFPGYQTGDTCGPDKEDCRHVSETNIIETDSGTITEYIREDKVL